MLGKTEGRRREQLNERVGWHHRLNEYEFEQTLGDSEEQGSLACCYSWVGHGLVTGQLQQQHESNFFFTF